MTTTLPREELMRALGERLPDLRRPCPTGASHVQTSEDGSTTWRVRCEDSECPGWIPYITLESLLTAMLSGTGIAQARCGNYGYVELHGERREAGTWWEWEHANGQRFVAEGAGYLEAAARAALLALEGGGNTDRVSQ